MSASESERVQLATRAFIYGHQLVYNLREIGGFDELEHLAPAGRVGDMQHEFRPLMRMYEPGAAALDGTYVLPAIVKSE
jgi:hypothetical protein